MGLGIGQNDLHIGYVLLKDLQSNRLPQLVSKLEETEQIKAKKFLRLEDKLSFALGRVLVRKILSNCAQAPSGGWRIDLTRSGKPVLVRSASMPDLRFNITHCMGLVAAIAAPGIDVGIDAEFLTDTVDYLEIARTYLPTAELKFLEGLTGDNRRDAFFRLWTLREAYLKATGEGLLAPSSDINFSLDPPSVSSNVFPNEKLAECFLWQEKLTPLHILAIAARRKPSKDLRYELKLFEIEDLCL